MWIKQEGIESNREGIRSKRMRQWNPNKTEQNLDEVVAFEAGIATGSITAAFSTISLYKNIINLNKKFYFGPTTLCLCIWISGDHLRVNHWHKAEWTVYPRRLVGHRNMRTGDLVGWNDDWENRDLDYSINTIYIRGCTILALLTILLAWHH